MRSRIAHLWLLIGVLVLIHVARLASATTFAERPFPETVQDAPSIVRGKVGLSYTHWVTAEGAESRRIYTFYELIVTEILKGDLPATASSLLMRELGGEKDGVGMSVAGAAKFSQGEDVVVLLGEKNADGSYDVRGLMMGKYNVTRNAAGEEVIVGPGTGGQGQDHDAHEGAGGQPDTSSQPTQWTLESVRQLIRTQSGKPAATPTLIQPQIQRPTAAHPSMTPTGDPSPPAPVAAPQLQTSPAAGVQEEPDSRGFGFIFWLVITLIGGLAAWWLWRRSQG